MSDNVVVAIITTGGTLLVALFGWLAKRRKHQSQSQSVPPMVTAGQAKIATASRRAGRRVSRRKIDLSHEQISDAIEAVPPLQRDNIKASFIGFYVTWCGTLFGASRIKDAAHISLDGICKDGGLVHCSSTIKECDALLVSTEGTEICVTGRIERVSKHEAHLEDCTFKVHGKPMNAVVFRNDC